MCQCILLLVFPALDGQSPVVQRGPARNIVEGQEVLWICSTPMDLLLQKALLFGEDARSFFITVCETLWENVVMCVHFLQDFFQECSDLVGILHALWPP